MVMSFFEQMAITFLIGTDSDSNRLNRVELKNDMLVFYF